MHTLLVKVYKDAGIPFPVHASSLNSGEDAAGRLANWNALLPPMQRTFAVSLTGDEKVLLVAGHPEVLEHIVEMVYTRGSADHHVTLRQLAGASKKKSWARQIDADKISHAVVMMAQAAGVYACVMASLLSVFVPQLCPPNARDRKSSPRHGSHRCLHALTRALPFCFCSYGARVHHVRQLQRAHIFQQGMHCSLE
jgi:hypothetical protein